MLSVAQEGQRSIRMDRNGCIFLSSALVQELGLQEGRWLYWSVMKTIPSNGSYVLWMMKVAFR